MSSQTVAIAPGARVLISDAEWIVKRVDRTGTGGQSIQVVGVSQIVRHKEARFLSEIEGKSITVLDPAETELVTYPSSQFRNSRLYLESLLRQSPPTGNNLWIGHAQGRSYIPGPQRGRWASKADEQKAVKRQQGQGQLRKTATEETRRVDREIIRALLRNRSYAASLSVRSRKYSEAAIDSRRLIQPKSHFRQTLTGTPKQLRNRSIWLSFVTSWLIWRLKATSDVSRCSSHLEKRRTGTLCQPRLPIMPPQN